MADISKLLRLLNGAARQVDVSQETLVVGSLKVGTATPTELTKTILDNLISHLSDTNNPHSVTKTQVGLGNVDNVQQLPMSYLDTDNTLAANSDTKVPSQKAIKSYVDTTVGAVTGSQVKISATDTTSEYLGASITVSNGTNSTNPLEKSIVNPGSNEQLDIKFDQSKVDHGSIAGLGDDDHTQYHNDARGDARYYQKTEFVTTATAGAPVKLDGSGKIAVAQLPSAIMTYEGVWNASTNSPTLADGVGDTGQVYRVSVAGTQDLGSGNISFGVGDYVIYNGSIWEKSDSTDAVVSVNGATGVVTVDAINELTGDITAGPATGSQSKVATIANNAVTAAKLNDDVAGPGMVRNIGTGDLSPVGDNSTIELSGGWLQVKNLGINSSKLANQAVTPTKIAAGAVNEGHINSDALGDGLAGGNGTVLSVTHAPKIQTAEVAGEALSASTLYALRYAMGAEDAGRLYKADKDASVSDKFFVIGLALPAGAISAADPITIVRKGLLTATSHSFTVGAPIFLSASGALTNTAPSAANEAIVKVGMAKDANTIDVDIQVIAVN